MTQRDIELILAQSVNMSLRIDLLDTHYIKINEIQGYATSLSPNISNSSDIRRICQLKMKVADTDELKGQSQELWLNRLIRPYLSVDDGNGTEWYLLYKSSKQIGKQERKWYNKGNEAGVTRHESITDRGPTR